MQVFPAHILSFTLHRIDLSESNSPRATSDPCEPQRNPSAPLLNNKQILTWSPLRLKILESSMILCARRTLPFLVFF